LAIPSDTVPNAVLISIHDFERGDRALVPVLNLAQHCLNIVGHRAFAQAGIDNRNDDGRDLVGKISPCSDRFREVGVETDFVVAHLRTKAGIPRFWMTFASRVTPGIGSLSILTVKTGRGQKLMLELGGGL
jgi:hypothetical protein